MATNPSTNMSLPIPVIGVEPGPDWASDINASLTIIDSHNHSAGSGVPITPAGISITSDLSLQSNNLTVARSVRFFPQSVALAEPTDLGCLYEVDEDLYYNDGSGNQIRITQSGAVAGTPGSIANLANPASATYVSADATFVWQSAVSTPANLDAGFIILRNNVASSNGLSLKPPGAMGSNFTVTLPTLPASQKFMTLDASGNMSAPWAVDGSTLEISSNTLQVKAQGITATQILNNTITATQIANNTITATQIANGTVTGTQIATDVNLAGVPLAAGRQIAISLATGSTASALFWGAVTSGGSVAAGSGFSVNKTGTGVYVVTCTFANFGGVPSWVASPAGGGGGSTCQISAFGSTAATVNTYNSGVAADIGFTFIAAGLR